MRGCTPSWVRGVFHERNGEEHFEFVHHNVSANDMIEGKIGVC